jgi:hypothetical protein
MFFKPASLPIKAFGLELTIYASVTSETKMNIRTGTLGWLCTAAFLLGLNGQSLAQTSAEGSWKDGFSLDVREGDRLSFMYSPFTHHFDSSPEHRYVWLVGVERERANRRVSGITYFSNSFGQPSTYIYPWGKNYPNVGGVEGLFLKWSAGMLYGYVEPYEKKVPLNVNGFSPAIIPSIGYERAGYSTQINLLGTAGLMWQISVPLGR